MKVTCGIWDDESVTTMHIVEEAVEYDDDDEDDDNCHQVVLQVRGQVVGLIWMYIPGFTIFAKLAELLNETPLWTSSCDRLALIESLALRRAKWFLNALKFIILFAVSVAPRNISALLVVYVFLSAASAILPQIPVFRKQAEKPTVTLTAAQELEMAIPATSPGLQQRLRTLCSGLQQRLRTLSSGLLR
jgi:hypothetical protein